jgi:hypothetical protein
MVHCGRRKHSSPGFNIQAVSELTAQSENAAARSSVAEDGHVMTRLRQLIRSGQAGEPRANDTTFLRIRGGMRRLRALPTSNENR